MKYTTGNLTCRLQWLVPLGCPVQQQAKLQNRWRWAGPAVSWRVLSPRKRTVGQLLHLGSSELTRVSDSVSGMQTYWKFLSFRSYNDGVALVPLRPSPPPTLYNAVTGTAFFSLLDFGRLQMKGTGPSEHCLVYAIIKDKVTEQGTVTKTICGGYEGLDKERHVYTSQGHEVEVRVMSRSGKDAGDFLLKYESR